MKNLKPYRDQATIRRVDMIIAVLSNQPYESLLETTESILYRMDPAEILNLYEDLCEESYTETDDYLDDTLNHSDDDDDDFIDPAGGRGLHSHI